MWNHWKRKIIDSPFWCEHQDDDPEDFWPALINLEKPDPPNIYPRRSNIMFMHLLITKYLKSKIIIEFSEVFDIGSELTGLIKTILVLGTSSADVERLFSIMVSCKYFKHINKSILNHILQCKKPSNIQSIEKVFYTL